jgi:hypothetical protein
MRARQRLLSAVIRIVVVDDGLTEHTADMQRLPILYLRHVLYLRHAVNPTSGSGAANRDDGLRPAVRAVNHGSLVRLRGMLPDTHRSSARGRLGRWSGFNSRRNGFARSRIPCSESPRRAGPCGSTDYPRLLGILAGEGSENIRLAQNNMILAQSILVARQEQMRSRPANCGTPAANHLSSSGSLPETDGRASAAMGLPQRESVAAPAPWLRNRREPAGVRSSVPLWRATREPCRESKLKPPRRRPRRPP